MNFYENMYFKIIRFFLGLLRKKILQWKLLCFFKVIKGKNFKLIIRTLWWNPGNGTVKCNYSHSSAIEQVLIGEDETLAN